MKQAISIVVSDTTLDQIEELQDMIGGTLSKLVRDALTNYHRQITAEFWSLEEAGEES